MYGAECKLPGTSVGVVCECRCTYVKVGVLGVGPTPYTAGEFYWKSHGVCASVGVCVQV